MILKHCFAFCALRGYCIFLEDLKYLKVSPISFFSDVYLHFTMRVPPKQGSGPFHLNDGRKNLLSNVHIWRIPDCTSVCLI